MAREPRVKRNVAPIAGACPSAARAFARRTAARFRAQEPAACAPCVDVRRRYGRIGTW
jgi:hypothetical protein